MSEIPSFLRSKGAIASSALLLGGVAAGVAVYESGNHSSEHLCNSPRATSRWYDGDSFADPRNQLTWTEGSFIQTHEIPADAEGLVLGYKSPSGDSSKTPDSEPWVDSDVIPKDKAEYIAVRIGPKAVKFSVRLVAKEGSPACNAKPDTTFSKEPVTFWKLTAEGVTDPHKYFPRGK